MMACLPGSSALQAPDFSTYRGSAVLGAKQQDTPGKARAAESKRFNDEHVALEKSRAANRPNFLP